MRYSCQSDMFPCKVELYQNNWLALGMSPACLYGLNVHGCAQSNSRYAQFHNDVLMRSTCIVFGNIHHGFVDSRFELSINRTTLLSILNTTWIVTSI